MVVAAEQFNVQKQSKQKHSEVTSMYDLKRHMYLMLFPEIIQSHLPVSPRQSIGFYIFVFVFKMSKDQHKQLHEINYHLVHFSKDDLNTSYR